MPRKAGTKGFSISLTPEQFEAIKALPGDKSALIRQMIRDYQTRHNLPVLPPDAPPGYELATKARLEKAHERRGK